MIQFVMQVLTGGMLLTLGGLWIKKAFVAVKAGQLGAMRDSVKSWLTSLAARRQSLPHRKVNRLRTVRAPRTHAARRGCATRLGANGPREILPNRTDLAGRKSRGPREANKRALCASGTDEPDEPNDDTHSMSPMEDTPSYLREQPSRPKGRVFIMHHGRTPCFLS